MSSTFAGVFRQLYGDIKNFRPAQKSQAFALTTYVLTGGRNSMSAEMGDIDGDGQMEIYATQMSRLGSPIGKNLLW